MGVGGWELGVDITSTCHAQLDDVAVGIGEIELFPGRDVIRPREALDARLSQMRDRPVEIRDAERDMPVSRIDVHGSPQRPRGLMDDEMKLPAVGQLVPGSGKREGRPRDLFQAKRLAVETLRALDIGDADGEVVKSGDSNHGT